MRRLSEAKGGHLVIDDQAIALLERDGWATIGGTLDDVRAMADRLGWTAVPLRRGEPALSLLRPVTMTEARRNSLSSRTGMGPQPLHTDGAHLQEPPHFVALAAAKAHRAATRLLPYTIMSDVVPWDDLHHGVFSVYDAATRYLAHALQHGQIRFDPYCMFPSDARARRVADFFDAALPVSMRHRWASSLPEVLLLDNRRVLHAREAVDPADPPRILQRLAFRDKELQ